MLFHHETPFSPFAILSIHKKSLDFNLKILNCKYNFSLKFIFYISSHPLNFSFQISLSLIVLFLSFTLPSILSLFLSSLSLLFYLLIMSKGEHKGGIGSWPLPIGFRGGVTLPLPLIKQKFPFLNHYNTQIKQNSIEWE